MLEQIQKELAANASADFIASVNKFVPGSQKVYGVKMPVLNELAKKYKDSGFDLVEQLWQSGAYEEKILAAKLLGKMAKKNPQHTLQLIKRFSNEIEDWAVCDTLGMQSIKPLIKTHAVEIFVLADKLSKAKKLWQRRLSLVLVESYTKQKEYHLQINRLVKLHENDTEYYVKKAVEWIKRNLRKN